MERSNCFSRLQVFHLFFSRLYTAAVECALTFECIVAIIMLVYGCLTARRLPIAIFKFNVLRLLFVREYRAGTNYMYHATFQPSCYCPVTQRRQQAVLNNLEKYNQICTKNSEHNVWMHCSDRVWLTIAKIPTSRHNIAVFLLLWKLSVNCKQLVLAGEVQQKVDWMWLANVLIVFGRPAVKRNTECARDNVLLLCPYVMQCPIPVRRPRIGNIISM